MVPLGVGNHEKAPKGHGASKLSVAPWVSKDKNGSQRTPKWHPGAMEPRSPRWLHGSSRPKWHPEDPEKTPAGHGATKASLAPWLSKTKMAPQRLGRRQSGATRTRLDEGFETFIRLGLLSATHGDMELKIARLIGISLGLGASRFENVGFPHVLDPRDFENV